MSPEQLSALRDAIAIAVSDPTSDPVTSVFVLGAMLVIVLMIVVGLLLALTPRRRKIVKVRRYLNTPGPDAGSGVAVAEDIVSDTPTVSDSDAGGSQAPTQKKRKLPALPPMPPRLARVLAIVLSVPALILYSLVAAYVVTGTQDYCARTCHAEQEHVRVAAEIDHATCTDCHEQRGVAGLVGNGVSRTRMLVSSLGDAEPGGPVVVDSANCLACHRAVLERTSASPRGLLMSHLEPHEAGVTCVSCHPVTGHDVRRDFTMSSCVTCHDGEQAAETCGTCHRSDPYAAATFDPARESTATIGSGDVRYPATLISDIGCGGCHNEKRDCDTCHGIRMPHTDAFRTTQAHARAAAFERKQLCFEKCHERSECIGCHIGNFETAHGSNWKREHAQAPRDAGCVCHAARTGRQTPMCDMCHSF